jgi:hypothetical protein
MERRDYLESQIEQLAQVLASMIGFITGNKGVSFELAEEAINKALQEELDIDLAKLIDLNDEELFEILCKTGKFNSENYERLADALSALAGLAKQEDYNIKVLKLYSKALLLYKYVELIDKNYSFLRNQKIKQAEDFINTTS